MATRYNLTKKQLATVKRASAHMGLPWQTIACRPRLAAILCLLVERLGVRAGCEDFART
jgi:hypothetical protein